MMQMMVESMKRMEGIVQDTLLTLQPSTPNRRSESYDRPGSANPRPLAQFSGYHQQQSNNRLLRPGTPTTDGRRSQLDHQDSVSCLRPTTPTEGKQCFRCWHYGHLQRDCPDFDETLGIQENEQASSSGQNWQGPL